MYSLELHKFILPTLNAKENGGSGGEGGSGGKGESVMRVCDREEGE